MGGIGDPLADCQSLNALLIATTQALDTLLPLLRAQEEGLAAIELEVREGLRGAQAEAEAFEQEVAQSGAGVVGALRELDAFASATRDAATALGTAADGAGEAAGRDLDQAGDRLHARFEELVSEPFATLEHDLAEEQQEFAQATTDTEEARTTLSSAFATAAAGIGDDLERGQQSFEHATDVVDDLTEQVGASVDGFLPGFVLKHTVPDALHETLRTRTEDLKGSLEAWERRMEAEAAFLQSSVASLAEAAASALGQSLPPLREGMEAFLRTWEGATVEAEQVAADLETSAPALETAAAHASRMVEIQQRIEWIGQVMDAMGPK